MHGAEEGAGPSTHRMPPVQAPLGTSTSPCTTGLGPGSPLPTHLMKGQGGRC